MSASGWIGVDLDGTIAEYKGWVHELHIGPPIPLMVVRVRLWLDNGQDVRIFTARVFDDGGRRDVGPVRAAIEAWCLEHIGKVLPVTNIKDYSMISLWDDRAVRVVQNEGIPCCSLTGVVL